MSVPLLPRNTSAGRRQAMLNRIRLMPKTINLAGLEGRGVADSVGMLLSGEVTASEAGVG
jgi:hypothetical protein